MRGGNKKIRLTTSDLTDIVQESVQRILSEHSHHQSHDWHNHHLTHMSDEEYIEPRQKPSYYSKRLANPKYNIYSDGKSVPIRKMEDSEIFANFKRSSRYLKNMEFVAYGKEKFNATKNTTWNYNPEGSWTKPWGGVWASPVNAQYGWAEYLNNGNLGSRIRDLSKHFRFKLSKSAKIYMIDNAQDLIAVSTKLGRYDDFSITAYWYIDFHKLCNDYGCDGVFITDKAACNLRRNIWLDDNGTNIVMSLWEWAEDVALYLQYVTNGGHIWSIGEYFANWYTHNGQICNTLKSESDRVRYKLQRFYFNKK